MSSPAEKADWAPGAGLPAPAVSVPVRRWCRGALESVPDRVAEEVPVGIMLNGEPHAVMLATPVALQDFALGFCLTEGVVESVQEVEQVDVRPHPAGIELHVRVPPPRAMAAAMKTRSLAGRTGCGMCGTSALDQAVRNPPPVRSSATVTVVALHRALDELSRQQPLTGETGSLHAAAWAADSGEVLLVREDVGRHNALDKLIGAMLGGGAPMALDRGFLVVTSRASYEMVQKAATAGISVMVAVSAPTALAIRLAQECGLTLVGFARTDSHVVYTHPGRIDEGNRSGSQ